MQSIHPLMVHFPIALLVSALALDAAALVFRRPEIHRVALWNLCLGTLGAGAAVWSGLQAQSVAKHSFEIWEVMEWHERLGITTLILGLILSSFRLLGRDHFTTRERLILLLVNAVMAGILTYGAYLGGRLVYELGVGGLFGR